MKKKISKEEHVPTSSFHHSVERSNLILLEVRSLSKLLDYSDYYSMI